MPRATKRNAITDSTSLSEINPINKQLLNDFMDYLKSIQRSESTISVYRNDLEIAFVWALKRINNAPFHKWTKRNIMQFQNYLVNENENSPARVRRIKATLSSLSNFIENILDEEPEFAGFRNIISKIESPPAATVREKTVLTDEQIKCLFDRLIEKKQYEKACMLALAAFSGRRKAELVRFKVAYFDDANIIYGSLYKTPEPVRTKGRGKGKFIYLYTLAKDFKPYFDLWMADRKEKGIESEWLFPDAANPNAHMNASTLSSWANSFSAILCVDFYWHAMRHMFVTRLKKARIPDGVIQSIIGWASADLVQVYTDTSTDDQLMYYFDDNGIKQNSAASITDM